MTANIVKKVQDFFSSSKTEIPKAILLFINKNSKKIFKEISLSPEDQLCADISNETYTDQDKRKKEIVTNYILDEKNSSKMYCIYSNADQKIVIIGYRGTVITEIKDVISDTQLILGIQGIDPRVRDALDIYDTIKREYKGYTIWICGHSLGGTICYIIAKHRTPGRCVVFNPGVTINTFFIQMLQDTLQHTQRTENTYTYKITGDIISTMAYVGHVKEFLFKASDPLKLHAIRNFVKNNYQ